MEINIKLDPTQAENYAAFHGFKVEDGISVEDFVTGKILDKIANDLLEKANRDALASVAPIVDITIDLKQTALREQAVALAETKLETIQVEKVPISDVPMDRAVK